MCYFHGDRNNPINTSVATIPSLLSLLTNLLLARALPSIVVVVLFLPLPDQACHGTSAQILPSGRKKSPAMGVHIYHLPTQIFYRAYPTHVYSGQGPSVSA